MTDGDPGGVLSRIEWESVPCPLCGAAEQRLEIRASDQFTGMAGDFAFVRCEGCGHIYLNPRPTPATIGLCYPADYGPHRTGVNDPATPPVRPWYARAPFRYIPGLRAFGRYVFDEGHHAIPDSPRIGSGPPPRALELGCATGEFLMKLQKAGWEVEGVEPGPQPAAIARERGLAVRTATVEECLFPSSAFDAIFAWMVVEHLHDPAGTLRKCFDALKPGGALCFSIPNAGSWERHAFGRYWMAYDPPRHLHHFTPASIRRLLQSVGFGRIEIRHQRNIRNILGSLSAWRLARRPDSRWAERLDRWFRDDPPRWFHIAAFPVAWGLSVIRQGGRLTIVALKPQSAPGGPLQV